jgi:hypothetical protein
MAQLIPTATTPSEWACNRHACGPVSLAKPCYCGIIAVGPSLSRPATFALDGICVLDGMCVLCSAAPRC